MNELCDVIDTKSPEVIPTVLFPDDDGHFRLAAGPKVPKIWNDAFIGMKVPSYASFLSTLGRHEKPVPIANMRSDPLFAACWDFVLSQGVQAACVDAHFVERQENSRNSSLVLSNTPTARRTRLGADGTGYPYGDNCDRIECHRNEEELREFSRRLYLSQNEERRRIARELHHSTGQKTCPPANELVTTAQKVKATIPNAHCRTISPTVVSELAGSVS